VEGVNPPFLNGQGMEEGIAFSVSISQSLSFQLSAFQAKEE
jgi:hypothetical protein